VRVRRSLVGLGAALACSCGSDGPALTDSGPIAVAPFLGPYTFSLTASPSCGQPSWAWRWNGEGTGAGANSVVTLPGGDPRMTVRLYDLMSSVNPRRVLVVLDLERAPVADNLFVTFYSLIESVAVPPGVRSPVSGLATGEIAVWDSQTFQPRSCGAADHAWELAPR
jgi:hypothetical protein